VNSIGTKSMNCHPQQSRILKLFCIGYFFNQMHPYVDNSLILLFERNPGTTGLLDDKLIMDSEGN
ncbi:hypothetical protein ACUWC3_28135, partial [Klebsiella pneumoniae]|uniref:hypothetical protein n=1 Tax=Klebsiella pneumoniae TaxID=573 RepID=UPI00405592D4